MVDPQRVELSTGLATGVVGFATIGIVFFAPLLEASGSRIDDALSAIASRGFSYPLPSLVGLVVCAVALGALWHSLHLARAGYVLLWLATGLLFAGMLASLLWFGLFLTPTVALAVVTAACAPEVSPARARSRG